MSFVYAELVVVVCIAYVISEVVTHKLPLHFYEGFFTYLYGVSILFLLYVFCFLLQESACCARGSDTPPPPPRPPKPPKEPKDKKKKEKKEKEQKPAKNKKDYQVVHLLIIENINSATNLHTQQDRFPPFIEHYLPSKP